MSRRTSQLLALLTTTALVGGVAIPVAAQDGTVASVDRSVVSETPGQRTLVLTLPDAAEARATVDWEIIDGATSPLDMTTTTGQVVVAAGARTATLEVPVRQDEVDEPDEDFTLRFSNPSSPVLDLGDLDLVLVDDDAPPVARPNAVDVRVVEGATGTTTATVLVDLDRASASPIEIEWQTVEGSAEAGVDFTSAGGTLSFAPGATTASLEVQVLGDTVPETEELFTVLLLEPGDQGDATPTAVLARSLVPVRIANDDARVFVRDAEAVEGDVAGVSLELSHPLAVPATVTYRTIGGVADGRFSPVSSNTPVVVPAGATTAVLPVQTMDDAIDDVDEAFDVQLQSAPTGVAILDAFAAVTVLDDDGGVRVVQTDVVEGDPVVDEGAGPAEDTLVPFGVLVRLDQPAVAPVTVEYETSSGTATAGDDFVARTGQVTIATSETTAVIDLEVIADLDIEGFDGPVDRGLETFEVEITNVTGGVAENAPSGTVRILDDEVGVALGTGAVVEGDVGADGGVLSLPVTLSRRTPVSLTIDVSAGIGTATAGQDYAAPGASVVVPAGSMGTSIDLTTLPDDVDESDETIEVSLVDAPDEDGVRITDAGGTSELLDDDPIPVVTLGAVDDVVEGTGATPTTIEVPVTLGAVSDVDVEVVVAAVDGASGVLANDEAIAIVRAGTTSAVARFETVTDGVEELDSRVVLRATGATNGVVGTEVADVVVLDDDAPDTGTDPDDPDPADPDPADPDTDPGPDPSITIVPGGVLESFAPATLSASDVPSGATVTWDFGDGTTDVGNPVDHAWSSTGTYTVVVTVTPEGGAASTSQLDVTVADTGDVTRSAGETRILTAVQASQDHWPAAGARASGPAGAVLLARADAFPDALAGGPLAATLDAPLLLTGSAALDPLVEEEIGRLGVDRVVLLGGEVALAPAVAERLAELGLTVDRIAGDDRFDTARLVAGRVGSTTGEAAVALGFNADPNRAWPDALSAGALAASPDRIPILLTRPEAVPDATATALDELDVDRVLLLGGPVVVSAEVEQTLVGLVPQVERIFGEDRYATSVAVARLALERADDGQVDVVFATGANFPDGLAAAAVAARRGGIVLLVPPTTIAADAATLSFLREHAERLDLGVVIGGPVAVSEDVRTALAGALRAG